MTYWVQESTGTCAYVLTEVMKAMHTSDEYDEHI